MPKKIHYVCCLINPAPKHSKHRQWDYFLMTQYMIVSMLKVGIAPEDISCIAYEKKHRKDLQRRFGINVARGPEIPRRYKRIMSVADKRKLFFYKPVSYSKVFNKPPDANTAVVMIDVDSLFVDNPTSYLENIESDVWSFHAFRYLRPSRKARLAPNFIRPTHNMTELTGYLGSAAQAHLLLKFGFKHLPEKRITSNFVAVQPNVFHLLVKTWKIMSDEIINSKYCKGDQEVLAAAIDHLELSYHCGKDFHFVRDYGGDKRKLMWADIDKLGIKL